MLNRSNCPSIVSQNKMVPQKTIPASDPHLETGLRSQAPRQQPQVYLLQGGEGCVLEQVTVQLLGKSASAKML